MELLKHDLHHADLIVDGIHDGLRDEYRSAFGIVHADLPQIKIPCSKEYFNKSYMSFQFLTIPSEVG